LKTKKFHKGYFYIAEHKKEALQNIGFLVRNSLLFFGLDVKEVVLTGMA